jgi:hypothetical protein
LKEIQVGKRIMLKWILKNSMEGLGLDTGEWWILLNVAINIEVP